MIRRKYSPIEWLLAMGYGALGFILVALIITAIGGFYEKLWSE